MGQKPIVVFPSDYFSSKTVDGEYMPERNAALGTGLFDCALFSYRKWEEQGILSLNFSGNTSGEEMSVPAIYRGWMMSPEKYCKFYMSLLQKGIRLITAPQEYKLAHYFPDAYPYLKADTAKIAIYPLHSKIDVDELKKTFGRFIVKDYVKSVKGIKFPAFFDENTTQKQFDEAMKLFYSYRGDILSGGICVKQHFILKKYGQHSNEWRVFYAKGIPCEAMPNSEQPENAARPPQNLTEKYKNLPSPYYCLDYAELETGQWGILESGDGGVSGLPHGQDIPAYYRFLHECLFANKV